jgi:hypothetical protein
MYYTLHAQGDHYTSVSGIWGTVWLEQVPERHISSLQIDANMHEINLTVFATAAAGTPFHATVKDARGKVVTTSSGKTSSSDKASKPAKLTITIPAPRQLWSPDSPYLYGLTVAMGAARTGARAGDGNGDGAGAGDDLVNSYFGLRSFTLGVVNGTTRPLLNGEFQFMMGWLDQSWWPDGQYTVKCT